jgi:hypothetical protein
MTTTPPTSVAVMKLSKAQYIDLCDTYRGKAQTAHQDARAARNQVLLLTAQLAILRAAYEPASTTEQES